VPDGVWASDPPVYLDEGTCRVQRLEPSRGYILEPDDEARIFVVVRAVGPGAFRIGGHDVVYQVGDETFQQRIQVGMTGEVEEGADPNRIPRYERACFSLTTPL
jgi:hypothetical protein